MIVGLRLYYLPQKYSHVKHLNVYELNRFVAKYAAVELSKAIQDIDMAYPDAFIITDGD